MEALADAGALGAGAAEDEPAGEGVAAGDGFSLEDVVGELDPDGVGDDELVGGVDCEVGVGSGEGDVAAGSGDGDGDVGVGSGAEDSTVKATERFPAMLPSSSLRWTATM